MMNSPSAPHATSYERLRSLEERRYGNSPMTNAINAAQTTRREVRQRYTRHSCMNAKKVKMPFGVSGYNEGMSIRNNTGRSITIRGRDNTLIRLSPNGFDENIERGVYYTVGFRGSEFVATDTSRHDGNRNLTSGKLLQLDRNDRSRRMVDVESMEYWYFVALEEIVSKGGTLYLEEIDKLVSVQTDEYICEHPFTYTSVDEHIVQAMREFSELTAGVTVFTVDNADRFGKRYINLNGNIMAVTPMVDLSRKEGVYLRLRNAIGQPGNEVEFYEFGDLDDKCPIRFYASIAEAERFGDEVEAMKREHEIEISHAKRDQTLASVQKAEVKDTIDAQATIRKDAFEAKSLARKDFYDQTSSERKDTYDDRSTSRKDESEETKAAIAAVGAAAAIGGIGYKLMSGGAKKVIDHAAANTVLSGVAHQAISVGVVAVGTSFARRTTAQMTVGLVNGILGGHPGEGLIRASMIAGDLLLGD